ncbi:hypothetical protein PoB_006690500 [Plakobranchus ocellatus]|uniref:Uncharacterized protein n=1 Tax=Plakobranchus ocellatus TaxID=259542 RepID=A0AAV4D8L7_9GAST|nr:hypothetical protein PoB_006690500 [Plakobranchus ocellatus]
MAAARNTLESAWRPPTLLENAIGIDAFAISWGAKNVYAIPPFLSTNEGSSKDQGRGGHRCGGCTLLVGTAIFSCPDETVSGPSNPALGNETPSTSSQSSRHPLPPSQETKTLECKVLGTDCGNNSFLQRLPKACWIPGGQTPKKHMPHALLSGRGTQPRLRWIQFHHL